MDRNLILEIAYDGSSFYGSQKQLDKRTVQGEIEKLLKSLFKKDIKTTLSGRTDRGVHAINQYLHFNTISTIDILKIEKFLNRALPKDILINKIYEANIDFNVRLNAIKREYIYKIKKEEDRTPFNCKYYCFKNIDKDLLRKELNKFVGEHDFKYFSTKNPIDKSTIKEIYNISVIEKDECIEVKIVGNSFLRGMIRIIMNTIFSVLDGTKEIDFIEKVLNNFGSSKNKRLASPEGLYFSNVFY